MLTIHPKQSCHALRGVLLLCFVCGMFSGVLGRLSLPDCLPFSKPKVNWLLHLVMVSRKQLLTRYPLHASVVNRSDRCETKARRRQKQIESKLTRDLYNKKSCPNRQLFSIEGAVSGTRTRDPQLGKLMLYQLSYYRGAVGKLR